MSIEKEIADKAAATLKHNEGMITDTMKSLQDENKKLRATIQGLEKLNQDQAFRLRDIEIIIATNACDPVLTQITDVMER